MNNPVLALALEGLYYLVCAAVLHLYLPVPFNGLRCMWKKASSCFTRKPCGVFRFTISAGYCVSTSCTVLFVEPLM